MRLLMADCQLPIGEPLPGRSFLRRCQDRGEFIGSSQKNQKFPCRHGFRFDQQFEPKRGFIGFFFNRSGFGDKFRRTAGSTTSPVICRDRSAASDDLFGNGAKLRTRSTIGDRQSAISK